MSGLAGIARGLCGLPDADFRLYVEALGWIAEHGTGGYIDRFALRLVSAVRISERAEFYDLLRLADGLVESGWWEAVHDDDGEVVAYYVPGWERYVVPAPEGG